MTARIRTHKRIEFWQTTNKHPPSPQHPPESLRSGLCGCVSVLCVSEELGEARRGFLLEVQTPAAHWT